MSRYAPPQPKPLQLSEEESKVIKTCLDGSFWTHSVPLSLVAFAGLKVLSAKGFQPGVFTHVFTVLGATVLGRVFAIPKCMSECAQKIPDGQIAQIMRSREGRHGFDDITPPSVESDPVDQRTVILDDNSEKSSALTKQTYDDLRRKNREQYLYSQNKKAASSLPGSPVDTGVGSLDQSPIDPPPASYYLDPLSPPSSYYDSPTMSDPTPSFAPVVPDEESRPRRRKRVNKYGDEIEE